ncbi:glycoside hydrolase family 13 [Pseudodesulfovibrio cashew]|uniref:Glycoside hydrolase family 13 n=1 Tax=Pseudodesulfovibrio cashew TaxID=2678688 RepID=A0A6I6JF43_9BACT|nr:glycogen-binding domain-containing protein [Pseudodesulfovibrio cashew]QGY38607.1 glycoside hydrolase family 13 [Pseudodesulfovibrio cashew]
MSGNNTNRLLDAEMENILRSMPEKAVPEGFSARVMEGLEPKTPSLWLRFKLWLTRPRSLTFTPMQVVPAAACVAALLALGFWQVYGNGAAEDGMHLSTVRFVLNDAGGGAHTVSVIGSFNDWDAKRSVMWYDHEKKEWVLEACLPPGNHEYVFLVDGKKLVPDPQAVMTRDDGFGNKNSVLFVNGANEQAL